ncbi:hypothetical protein [Xanthomonas campestris]|uniref:hypothetical protein n=1 Tax=Xanthomonas campestris TaxID=339 RepID=UPI002379199E|nr:hypothetical protein [Xanthomonas campestris]WDJ77844.1 hypothetical protein JH282_05150 [Xanthomonas campestris pv. campestris]
MIGNAAELARLEAKQACAICLAEPYLVSLFPENVEFQGVKCDYCGRRSLTLGLKWIGNQCQLVFDDFYEGTAEDDKVVIFERRPDGDEIHECIGGLFPGAAVDLLADLSELLLLRLDEEDGSDPDPYYIRRNRLGEFFSVDWRNMSDSLRNEARLCNPLAFRTLERFFGPIANDATLDGKDLILSVGPTSTITTPTSPQF